VMKTAAGMRMFGDRRLLRAWDAMPRKAMSSRSTNIVLNAGCGAVAKAARAIAAQHSDTGLLAKNIIVKRARRKYRGTAMAMVGVRNKLFFVRKTAKGTWRGVSGKKARERMAAGEKVRRVNPGNYAHLVEFGTGPKRPKHKRAMKMPVGFSMKAGPTQARPFLRPAFDAAGGVGLLAMERAMERAIIEAMRSVA